MLLLLIILLLVLGGGGGYYGHSRWGYGGGAGVGLGTILVVLLVVYMMGGSAEAKPATSRRPVLTDGAPMSRLSTFFKDSDTELGIFYTKHDLLAVFPN